MIEFRNDQINLSELPGIESIDFQPIEIRYRKVLYILNTIWFSILFIGLINLIFFKLSWNSWLSFLGLGVWTCVYLFSLYFARLSVKCKGYAIRDLDISYQSGVWFKDWITIPFNRVQHCEISKGILDQLFNLVELKVFTAGGSSSDLNIPGLNPNDAHRIKDYIIGKVNSLDEEE